jgi:hypothetical protein
MFGWLVADGWCWFVLREEYCWLVTDGWFVLREKYCWLVAGKPSEQAVGCLSERAAKYGEPLVRHIVHVQAQHPCSTLFLGNGEHAEHRAPKGRNERPNEKKLKKRQEAL